MPRSWTVVCALAVASPLVATPPSTAQSRVDNPPVTEEKVGLEGRRALREEYYEQRRRSLDPKLDRGAARRDAVAARQAAERLEGPVTLPAWESFGPGPIANGQTPTSSPRHPSDVSGRITALAIDEVNEVVYLGGAQGGVWASSDNGASWTPLSDGLLSTAVGAIAVVPPATGGDPATIYLGTGESSASCDSYAGVGLYKSTDSGATWSGPIGGAQFGNRSISGIVVDRTDPTHVLLTTASGAFGVSCISGPSLPSRGVFRSTDSGATWSQETINNLRFSMVMQDPATATTWWAPGFTSSGSIDPTNEGGLYKSTDNGDTWSQVAGTGGLPALATSWGRAWITGTFDTTSVLYLANSQTVTGFGQGRIFKSTDGGANWSELTATGARGFCSAQCFYDMPIFVEPGDADILYTGGAGTSTQGVVPSQMMRSTDGGGSFADIVRSADMSTAQHADVHAIVTWPGQPNRLWTGNDGGVWRSDDRGTNWVNVNSNLELTQFTRGDLHPFNHEVVYAGSQDNGTEGRPNDLASPDNIWKHLDFGDGGYAQIDQSNPDNLVHTYFNQSGNLVGVGFTTNGFATTMGFYTSSFAPANGITISDRVQFYAPIHLDRGASSTLYYGTHRLWRATDFFNNPNSFVVLNGGVDLSGGSPASLTAIETFPSSTPGANADLIYTGSSSGRVQRSTNGGTSFVEVDVGASSLFVSDVLIDRSNSQIVWQSRSGFAGAAGLNVRRSTDGGTTWAPAATGLPDIPVNALAQDPVINARVWAGTDAGVYYTEDGGASWTPHNTGLPTTAIYDLVAKPRTRTLVALTHGRSAFRLYQGIFQDGFERGNASAWSTTAP